ncbi:MAG: preprotein translocase subunit SecG [Nevskiales bacterium]
MYAILAVIQVIVALAIIGLVLLQQGKGADMGAAFGAGASGTLFGSRGSANFLSHATAGLAAVFFIVSLSLAYLVNQGGGKQDSVLDAMPAPTPQLSVPVPTELPADAPAPTAPTEAPE